MKTLEQMEPRTDLATVAGDANYHHVISQPGSYYLSGNLSVTKTNGIHITSARVTLDLNGFEIYQDLEGTGYGIMSTADRTTVRNGTILGFNIGVEFLRYCLLEKLAVSGCSTYGIHTSSSTQIIDCQAHDNPGGGIYTGNRSLLRDCTASGNGAIGIWAVDYSSLYGCIAFNNQGYGITAGVGSTLSGCIAYYNQGTSGILAGDGSSLSGCTALNNQSTYGIWAFSGSTLSGCTASENAEKGISAGDGSTLSGCTATDNGYTGIVTEMNSSLSGCTASGNAGNGIEVSYGSSLRGCTANGNSGNGSTSFGISAGDGSSIIGCTARGNSNTNSPSTPSQGGGIYAGYSTTIKDRVPGFGKHLRRKRAGCRGRSRDTRNLRRQPHRRQ